MGTFEEPAQQGEGTFGTSCPATIHPKPVNPVHGGPGVVYIIALLLLLLMLSLLRPFLFLFPGPVRCD